MVGRPSEEDALRLVLAFYCITEPDRRAELIALAESFASRSQVVEAITHFLMLEGKPATET